MTMGEIKEISQVLQAVTTSAVHSKLEDWLRSLSTRELSEVRALATAFGQIKYRKHSRNLSMPSHVPNSLRSSYEEAYGSLDQKQSYETAILRYRKLRELPCSSVLTAHGIEGLQGWLDTADSTQASSVLNGLRTLYSLLTVSVRPPTSNNRTSYSFCSPEDFRRSTVKHDFFPRRRLRQYASKLVSASDSPTKTAIPMPPHAVSTRQRPRGAHMLSDKRLLFYGDGDTDPASSYQKTYVTHYYKYKTTKSIDFHTSYTQALIPDLNLSASFI